MWGIVAVVAGSLGVEDFDVGRSEAATGCRICGLEEYNGAERLCRNVCVCLCVPRDVGFVDLKK